MSDTRAANHVRIAIAGSGFGGIGLGIRLLQSGIDDFAIFERADDVGGVWRDNTYPGCACDVESHLYSFSFAPNPSWTRAYSPAAEIWQYLRDCAVRFGVRPHIRFGHEIREAAWDAAAQRWVLETSRGRFTADFFVAAVGALSEPAMPSLPGLETFRGRVFHSARWDHSFALDGKSVAVVGTGASAIQFVPQIQPRVGKLHLFQRTPPWIVPRNDFAFSEKTKARFRRWPLLQRLLRAEIFLRRELFAIPFLHTRLARVAERLVRRHLDKTIADPVLRAKLTPSYRLGCKRILVSDDYLPSLTQPNVDVITDAIAAVTPTGIVTRDGRERAVDAIICGTGFHVTDMPMARHVRGRDGRSLEDVWGGSMHAHLGTTVHGFPNFFFLLGPNTGLGHTSVILMIEHQIEHLLGALAHLATKELATLEPTVEAQSAWLSYVDGRMRSTVWTTGGCASWYLDRTGRNSTLWPGYTFTFGRRVAKFDATEYICEQRRSVRAIAAA